MSKENQLRSINKKQQERNSFNFLQKSASAATTFFLLVLVFSVELKWQNKKKFSNIG